ncbi:DUF6879 family protein [Streptomyces mirabilis]|uniref:DUF6879 family protein n=1 Tax=Streptomyces mirabilis TaxID=68239 RepID=UPI003719E355
MRQQHRLRHAQRAHPVRLGSLANDFWLFDSSLVLVNHFDGEGENMEVELKDDPAVAKLCESAFEAVWVRATPHAEFQPV